MSAISNRANIIPKVERAVPISRFQPEKILNLILAFVAVYHTPEGSSRGCDQYCPFLIRTCCKMKLFVVILAVVLPLFFQGVLAAHPVTFGKRSREKKKRSSLLIILLFFRCRYRSFSGYLHTRFVHSIPPLFKIQGKYL